MSIQCGLCEKTVERGAQIMFANPQSNGAHEQCLEKFEKLGVKVRVAIGTVHTDYYQTHEKLICALREKCGEPIIDYVDRKGLEDLIKWFDETGIKIIEEIPKK